MRAVDIGSLAESLARLAHDLHQHDDPATLLEAIVRGAIASVPGAEEGSARLLEARRQITAQATIGDLAPVVDRLQQEVQEGPGLDSIHDQRTVRVDDLRSEGRWPRFAPRVGEAGVASILSLPLCDGGESLGALDLHSRLPNAFSHESELIGVLYAGHAALMLSCVRARAQLKQAILSRDLIGQAKGILMERHTISDEHAFALLTRTSQDTNQKLRDIADDLVRTRTFTGRRGLPSPDRPIP